MITEGFMRDSLSFRKKKKLTESKLSTEELDQELEYSRVKLCGLPGI